MGLAQAASRAIVFWLWYTALEPYVRRLWPQTLICWSRLLEGRWRDPLVGRDLLVGCLFGLAQNLAHQSGLLAPHWLGRSMRQLAGSPSWTLAGPGSLVADCLYKQLEAVFFALFFLMTLLLLRFVFRKMWLASIVYLALFTAVTVMAGGSLSTTDWLSGLLGTALTYWILVQWGFLACAVSLLCANFLTFPLTTHWSAWYAPHGLAGLALVGLIALVGFFNSRDQPISRRPDPI
jgi:serine/threonine-protein kinase